MGPLRMLPFSLLLKVEAAEETEKHHRGRAAKLSLLIERFIICRGGIGEVVYA